MYIIEPIYIPSLAASTVPYPDYPVWAVGTTYAENAMVTWGRVNYRSVQGGNTGNNPPPWRGGDLTWWVPIEQANRWRVFDGSLGGVTSNAESIYYEILLPQTIDSLAAFGLSGGSVRVRVLDVDSATLYDRTVALVSSETVIDAWTYFFNEIEYTDFVLLNDLPGYSGNRLIVSVLAPAATAEMSELFIGNNRHVGVTLVDSKVGIRDYSIKERDAFGNQEIVARGFTSVATFNFAFETEDATRIKNLMSRIRSKAAVYYADLENPSLYGMLIPGFYKDFDVPLSSVVSYGVLEVESLI